MGTSREIMKLSATDLSAPAAQFSLEAISCIPNFAIVNYLAKSRQHVVLLRPSPANLQPGARAADPFPQFNRLFPELRWMVWEQALSHERVLHVELREPLAVNDDESKDENEAETNDGYSIVLKERRAISKLFRVNAESRHVVLCFYRVQLPCHYQWNGQLEENGTLYFNPELDTLQFRNTKYLAMFGHGWTTLSGLLAPHSGTGPEVHHRDLRPREETPPPAEQEDMQPGQTHYQDGSLHRRIGNRQTRLFAIGGSIGNALFVSIGGALFKASPVGLLLAFIFYSCLIGLVNNSMAEVCVLMLISRGFVRMARKWVDEALGFMAGFNLFCYRAICIGFEIIAINVVLRPWRNDVYCVLCL
ncbi:hypothetical protein ACJZ2D_001697 [Fusarium nematophilum]